MFMLAHTHTGLHHSMHDMQLNVSQQTLFDINCFVVYVHVCLGILCYNAYYCQKLLILLIFNA